MFGSSNGLGIGPAGKTFQMVPPQLHMRTPLRTVAPQPAPTTTTQQLKEPVEEVPTRPEPPKQPEVSESNQWNNAFNTVCSNQLYGNFRKVKTLLVNSKYFRGTRICYVDYSGMQMLVSKARTDKSARGLMSLKSYMRSPTQDVTDINDIESSISLVQSLEMMGPPDHALIPLQDDQIDFLKSKGGREMFWPNGTNGITWISNSTQSSNWE
jgi:hypothetical protein